MTEDTQKTTSQQNLAQANTDKSEAVQIPSSQPVSVQTPPSAPLDLSSPAAAQASVKPTNVPAADKTDIKAIKPIIKKTTLGQELLHSRELPFILFLGVVILLAWIYLSVREVTLQATIPPEVQQQTKQMNPVIDVESIQKVRDRRFFEEEELTNFPLIKVEPSPEPGQETRIVQPRPTATPETQPQATPPPETAPEPQPTSTPEPSPLP